MNQAAFSFIFLILFISIVQCKKYLVEVEDEKGGGDNHIRKGKFVNNGMMIIKMMKKGFEKIALNALVAGVAIWCLFGC